MQVARTPYDFTAYISPDHFGALLRWLRDRHGLMQADIVAHLPSTIVQQRYSSFELDKRFPLFDELPIIYQALKDAGVRLTIRDRTLFLALARGRLEAKRTHKVHRSDSEWDDLRAKLAEIDKLADRASPSVEMSITRSTLLAGR